MDKVFSLTISRLIGLSLLVFLIFYLVIPNGYEYNSDIALSPYGIKWARGFIEIPEQVSKGKMGYINNSVFGAYTNWPAVGFKIIALWLKTMGDSLYQARLFMVLVSTLTSLLFYGLISSFYKNKLAPFILTFLFITLPHHLTFSSLIYADIWVLPFWTLFLLAVAKKKNIYILSFISIVGFFFMWMILLILPAYFVARFFEQKRITFRQLAIFSICLFAFFNLSIFLLNSYVNHRLAERLFHYSFWGFMNRADFHTAQIFSVLKGTFIFLFLEFASLFLLLGYYWTQVHKKAIPDSLKNIISITVWTLILFLMIFFNWFIMHPHSIVMFSLFIGLSFCAICVYLPRKQLMNWTMLALTVNMICFFVLPVFAPSRDDIKGRDEKIIQFINTTENGLPKKCIILDKRDNNWIEKFEINAISTLCNAYTLYLKANHSSISEYIEKATQKLEKLSLKTKIDYESVYFITQNEGNSFSPYVPVDSLKMGNIRVYKLNKGAGNK